MGSTEKALELLARLRGMGVTLRQEDGRLKAAAPDGVLTAEVLQGIAEHRDDILSFLCASQATAAPRSFERIPREGPAPLSFSQERLWLLHQLEPSGSEYNVAMAVRMLGPLDVDALNRSFEEIWRRHEALRTRFAATDADPVQVIDAPGPVPLLHVDLRRLPSRRRAEETGRLLRYYASCAFSLSNGPLSRQVLLRLAGQDHVLMVVIHHVIFDGWSQAVFARELSVLYRAFHHGEASPLPEPVWQYQDYARWQRRHAASAGRESQLDYWRRKLEMLPPVLDLLTDRPRPVAQSPRGAQYSFSLSGGTSRALAELARAHGATVFMVLLAGAYALLYRWTGQRDIAIGTPVANRPFQETEDIIGFFVNTLVLRTRLSGSMSFLDLLGAVRETTLEAYSRQEVPFENVLQAVQPQRTLSHSPLFQVMLALQNTPRALLELEGLRLEPVTVPGELTKFELNIHLVETEAGIEGTVFYSADLFEPSTIHRLLSGYRSILEAAAAKPAVGLREVPLGQEDAVGRAMRPLPDFPPNRRDPFPEADVEGSIPRRFEKIREAFPQRLAVSCGEVQWTYVELDRQANRIAGQILAAERPPGRIGLLFGHDPLMVSAVLGALKAGWTCVPLDPLYPPKRLEAVLAHAECTLLVADQHHADLAARLAGGCQVVLAETGGGADRPTAERPSVNVSPDTPAYILYTSGSTGQPKGVVQTHRNVLHFMRVYTNVLRVVPEDRLTLLSTYCYDAAVMDLFASLLNGASLHLYDLRDRGFEALPSWIRRAGITVLHSTPTVFRHALEPLPKQERFPSVRLVVLGGEAAFRRDFELYRGHFPPQSFFVNGLGPTESTVTLQFIASPDTELSTNEVPVGRAVPGCEVQLLDESGGNEVQGEIVIRGRHLALGYYRQPEMTQAAFHADPAGGPERTYHTGDLGRLLPSGDIVFVGRRDSQLKIRGYRVEPGESESLLRRHPGVRSAAVVARRTASGEAILAAYVVRSPALRGDAEDLLRHLREHLPDHLVPSVIVPVERLPLLPNGKLDLGALPPPPTAGWSRRTEYTAPRTELERAIAGCWESVLGVRRVGVHDDFFELGGSSLSATRIIARLRQSLPADLTLRSLFADPTPAGLAGSLAWDAARRAFRYMPPHTAWGSVVPIQPRGDRLPFWARVSASCSR